MSRAHAMGHKDSRRLSPEARKCPAHAAPRFFASLRMTTLARRASYVASSLVQLGQRRALIGICEVQ